MSMQDLKRAFAARELTLYLGAGVSMTSGLPGWDRLVLTMYLAALGGLDRQDNPLRDWRVFPNYLEAIAEWLLRTNIDPAEITAQKIRSMVFDDAKFVELLKETLYAPIRETGPRGNVTLEAVRRLGSASGARAIVTYNYDDLVERDCPAFAPVWQLGPEPAAGKVPIFHVHGFLPPDGGGSTYAELVLTEEQFHAAASDPYSWSNLVQMRQIGSTVGLMVGMSLSDRNLRRILKTMRKLPDRSPQYAILKVERRELSEDALGQIEEMAEQYGQQRKVEGKGRDQVQAIFRKLDEFDREMKIRVLDGLGVQVLWVDDYGEIPRLLEEIERGA